MKFEKLFEEFSTLPFVDNEKSKPELVSSSESLPSKLSPLTDSEIKFLTGFQRVEDNTSF